MEKVIAKKFHEKVYGGVYRFVLNDMKMKPKVFRERSEAFYLEPDPYMGVCLSNKELHTVMVDVEDANHSTLTFEEKDKEYVEKILGIEIELN